MAAEVFKLAVPGTKSAKITKWKVRQGSHISKGVLIALYCTTEEEKDSIPLKLKAPNAGIVKKILIKEGQLCEPGTVLLEIEPLSSNVCSHPTVMKDMCAECGADLRCELGLAGDRREAVQASVAMVHCIPELIVSEEVALELGKADENRLLSSRKLALLVDLDQTLIHTTNDSIPNKLKDVYHFQLWHGRKLLWYHTKFRPSTNVFLETISKLFELHICTFGVRMYAHTIARFIDPDGKYFSHRILSRDECFNAMSKTANLKALFPCGDCMVAIIDDREDVWNYAPNLIHVKPYHFFQGTADINAPPGLTKTENDNVPVSHEVRRSTTSEDITKPEETGKTASISIIDPKISGNSVNVKSQSGNTDNNTDKTGPESDNTELVSNNDSGNTNNKSESGSTESISNDESGNNSKIVVGAHADDIEMKEVVQSDVNSNKAEADNKNSQSNDNPLNNSKGDNSDTPELANDKSTEVLKSEQEEEIEWVDDDDYLIYLTDILTRIHKAYYDVYDQMNNKDDLSQMPNIKNIIPYVKRKVLKGVNIVFSGVVPLNMPPEKSRAHLIAKSLGACIHTNIVLQNDCPNEATTHLVASKAGTAKYKLASKLKSISVVNLDWLMCCSYRWERVDERLYPVSEDFSMSSCDSPVADFENIRKKIAKKNKKRKAEDSDSVFATENNQDSTSKKSRSDRTGASTSQKSGRFATSFNPLYSFSDEDIECMDKEVEDLMDDDEDDSEEEDVDRESRLRNKVLSSLEDSSTDDSLEGNFPKGWKKKTSKSDMSCKKVEEGDDSDAPVPDEDSENELDKYQKNLEAFSPESNNSDSDKESIGSVDDEIADAVEKEFLSML